MPAGFKQEASVEIFPLWMLLDFLQTWTLCFLHL